MIDKLHNIIDGNQYPNYTSILAMGNATMGII